MSEGLILDLCAGTGAWSRPYREAGYDVRTVTLPETDVRDFQVPDARVHGVLAAPPCTCFASSGAWTWADKDASGETLEALSIVSACCRVIMACAPVWWCIENPVGRLYRWIGPWKMTFQPCDYGDAWTKRTCLWGRFAAPKKTPVEPTRGSICRHKMRSPDMRAITPPGFAQAFFEANP